MIVSAPLCVLIAFEIVIVSYSKLISHSSIAKYSEGLSPRLDRTIYISYISKLDRYFAVKAFCARKSLAFCSSSSLRAGFAPTTSLA